MAVRRSCVAPRRWLGLGSDNAGCICGELACVARFDREWPGGRKAGADPLELHHRAAPVPVALDVHGPRAYGNAEKIGVDGKKTGSRVEIGVPNRGIS